MECKSVIIRRRRTRGVLWQSLGDDGGQCDDHKSNGEGIQSPLEGLSAANDAPQVHVFLLLLGFLWI